MIIEVELDGEGTPRRYRVHRDDGTLTLRRLADGGAGDGSVPRAAGDAPAAPAEVHVDWRMPEPRVYSVIVDGRSYDVHVDETANDEEQLVVHLMSRVVRARASDARKRRVSRQGEGPDGLARIVAPMPGRVVRVLASEGTAVSRGDGIIVLEAMKMENELKAPRDGTVTTIAVREGQGVEGGALLATIE